MKFIYPAIFSKTTRRHLRGPFPGPGIAARQPARHLTTAFENANQAAYDWIYVELTEFDSELPPITDPDDLVLSDNETLRNISVKYSPHRWLGRINTPDSSILFIKQLT